MVTITNHPYPRNKQAEIHDDVYFFCYPIFTVFVTSSFCDCISCSRILLYFCKYTAYLTGSFTGDFLTEMTTLADLTVYVFGC
jgi:hypothetical protein